MKVLRTFWYRTLWMSKRYKVTLPHVITVYNDMFDHMDSIMCSLAKKKTEWKEDLYITVKLAWQKLSKYYTDVIPMTGRLLISALILDPFRMLQSCEKWDKRMDNNPEDETSYTIQKQKAFLKYVENEYCAKHRWLPAIKPETVPSNNLISCTMASRSGQ